MISTQHPHSENEGSVHISLCIVPCVVYVRALCLWVHTVVNVSCVKLCVSFLVLITTCGYTIHVPFTRFSREFLSVHLYSETPVHLVMSMCSKG